MANNLKRLASQRTDVFDPVTGQPLSEDELNRRKKAAVHSVEAPSPATAQGQGQGQVPGQANFLQGMNVEDQIRAIHQKFAAEKR